MTRVLINTHCGTLPGAALSDPWGGGHDARKVGGKMFAIVGVMDIGVSVKCADVETAALLIEMGRAVRDAVSLRVQARTGVPTSWRNVIITPGGASGAVCNAYGGVQ